MLNAEIILEKIPGLKLFKAEPMSRHTTFKVGGAARFFARPKNAEEIAALVEICRSGGEPYAVIGKGSNLLVSDEGYDGLIICIGEDFSAVTVSGLEIEARAGASLIGVCAEAKRAGLTGLEFACGIPGSVGGAIYMNAGAYGGEMKDVVASVTVMDEAGNVAEIPADEMDFGYRRSRISDGGLIVLSAKFRLKEGDPEQIGAAMSELMKRRSEKQPVEYPSAGSTFKRPEGAFAGKLIEDAGLRGYSVGGAQVSEKHCGFVINKGGATASDIMALCEHIRKTVKDASGYELEMEVKKLGKF